MLLVSIWKLMGLLEGCVCFTIWSSIFLMQNVRELTQKPFSSIFFLCSPTISKIPSTKPRIQYGRARPARGGHKPIPGGAGAPRPER